MAKSNSFPSNKDREPEFSVYNSMDRDISVGYNPDMRNPYYFAGRRYGESSIIWLPIYYHCDDFGCNIDPGETRFSSKFKCVLYPSDSDFAAIKKVVNKKKEPGIVTVCKDGNFNVLCNVYYDAEFGNIDYVTRIFNAELCRLENRNCWGNVTAQINDFHVYVGIRYAIGKELDWERSFDVCRNDSINYYEYEDYFGDGITFTPDFYDDDDYEDDCDDCDNRDDRGNS